MRTIILSLMMLAVAVTAGEPNPRVLRIMETFDGSVTAAEGAYEQALERAEAARTQALNTARDRAVVGLKRLITSRSPFTQQAEVYKEVLRLNQADDTAMAFFSAIGTLERVLEEIDPLVATDLVGDVVSVHTTQRALRGRHQLVIESARYGFGAGWIDVITQVQDAFDKESGLHVTPSNHWAGRDPAPGSVKLLEITFSFGPIIWTESAAEGEPMALSITDLQKRIQTHSR